MNLNLNREYFQFKKFSMSRFFEVYIHRHPSTIILDVTPLKYYNYFSFSHCHCHCNTGDGANNHKNDRKVASKHCLISRANIK